jgi:Protein of unknown function (DUF1073)
MAVLINGMLGAGIPEGSPLYRILMATDIVPGDEPSYETCKILLAYHPLGDKLTLTPMELAQSQPRDITVQAGPEDELKEAFELEWKALKMTEHLASLGQLSRAYGISSLALFTKGTPNSRPLNRANLWEQEIGFNLLDPLNTAGSLVLNQDPTSVLFQKTGGISVAGQPVHRSRSVVLQNGNPLYILWTNSAYGFTGRSVFQRILYPLKTYVETMVANRLVVLKSSVLVAKMKGPGSVVNQLMEKVAGLKRDLVKEAALGSVLSIGLDEAIETLDFTNMEGPFTAARKFNLDDIATGAGMPAILINQETFAEGFGEGTEDAKKVGKFVSGVRVWADPAYAWADDIVCHRAWSPELYERLKRKYPRVLDGMTYRQAFYKWQNSFKASWPNFLEEPESEEIAVDEVKFKAVVAAFQVLMPELPTPALKAELIKWLAECFNERKDLFPSPLELDYEDVLDGFEDQASKAEAMQQQQGAAGSPGEEGEPPAPPPFSARDSAREVDLKRARVTQALTELSAAVKKLPGIPDLPSRVRAVA